MWSLVVYKRPYRLSICPHIEIHLPLRRGGLFLPRLGAVEILYAFNALRILLPSSADGVCHLPLGGRLCPLRQPLAATSPKGGGLTTHPSSCCATLFHTSLTREGIVLPRRDCVLILSAFDALHTLLPSSADGVCHLPPGGRLFVIDGSVRVFRRT